MMRLQLGFRAFTINRIAELGGGMMSLNVCEKLRLCER